MRTFTLRYSLTCECGCGTPIPAKDSRGRPRRYVHNHHLRGKTGPANHNWRGGAADYFTTHEWMNRYYPRAGICEECGEDGRRTEYASLTAPDYTRNREDYAELCVPCHRRLDA